MHVLIERMHFLIDNDFIQSFSHVPPTSNLVSTSLISDLSFSSQHPTPHSYPRPTPTHTSPILSVIHPPPPPPTLRNSPTSPRSSQPRPHRLSTKGKRAGELVKEPDEANHIIGGKRKEGNSARREMGGGGGKSIHVSTNTSLRRWYKF